MPRPTSVTVAYNGTNSAAIPVNWRAEQCSVSVAVVNTGDVVSKVQTTLDDIYDSTVTPTWFTADAASGLDSVTAGTPEVSGLPFPVRAIRLVIVSGTSGASTMTILQQGY